MQISLSSSSSSFSYFQKVPRPFFFQWVQKIISREFLDFPFLIFQMQKTSPFNIHHKYARETNKHSAQHRFIYRYFPPLWIIFINLKSQKNRNFLFRKKWKTILTQLKKTNAKKKFHRTQTTTTTTQKIFDS